MHICFVCREYPPSLRGGGIASYIKEVAHGLNALGHRVTVVCASDDTRKEKSYDEDGVNIIRLIRRRFHYSTSRKNIHCKKI